VTFEVKFLRVYGSMTLSRLGLKCKVIGQGHAIGLGLSIDSIGRNIRFYSHVISCALARRGVQHGAAETEPSARGRGNAVRRSV